MGTDIMADNQTESVLTLLDRGEADNKVQQAVSAALLRSQTKIIEELQGIRSKLWQLDDLRKYVDEWHDSKCKDCPTKKLVETKMKAFDGAAKGGWVNQLASNSGFQFFILLIFLVSAFCYLVSGKDGVDAAKSVTTSVLTGGVK